MTLGERLQQLRKEKQMSQEELGNLLLVSRQTVSLWENNQTVPTVDNLIRLKEIFGVSIDSILTGEEPTVAEAAPEAPSQEVPTNEYQEAILEAYSYSVSNKDLFFLSKIYCTKTVRAIVVFFTFLIGSAAATSTTMAFAPFTVFFCFAFLISLLCLLRCFIHQQKVKRDMCRKSFACELYQNYIILKSYKDGGLVSTRRVLHHEIKAFWNMPYSCFILTNENLLFPIKKSVFEELSYMGYLCNNLTTPKNDFRTKNTAFMKVAASALFIGSFVSFYLAIACSVTAASAESTASLAESIEAFRSFHFFLPVPILSVIAGIILNKNKIRNRKNIVVGIIIGLYMLIFGFAPAFASSMTSRLDSVEALLGFEFPGYTAFRTTTTTDLTGDKYSVTTLEIAESSSNEFEEFMRNDTRWANSSNEAFTEILPDVAVSSDFCLIYNVTTDEFGKLPDSEGEYEFIYISYDTEMNTAYIFEYTADYQK